MKRVVLPGAVLVLAVLASLVVPAGGARAQPRQPQPTLQDGCKSAPASTTLTWGVSAPASQVTSSARYGTATCPRYVADFQVGQLVPLGGHTTDFQIEPGLHWTNELLHLGAEQCQTLVVDATIYRRAPGSTDLVRIGGGRKHGAIQTSSCTLVPEASWVSPPAQTPPAQGTMLIRVAEIAKLGQQQLPVNVTLHRPY